MGQDLKADRKELFEGQKQKRLVKRTLCETLNKEVIL